MVYLMNNYAERYNYVYNHAVEREEKLRRRKHNRVLRREREKDEQGL